MSFYKKSKNMIIFCDILQNISFFIENICYNPPHENIKQIHIKANFDRLFPCSLLAVGYFVAYSIAEIYNVGHKQRFASLSVY